MGPISNVHSRTSHEMMMMMCCTQQLHMKPRLNVLYTSIKTLLGVYRQSVHGLQRLIRCTAHPAALMHTLQAAAVDDDDRRRRRLIVQSTSHRIDRSQRASLSTSSVASLNSSLGTPVADRWRCLAVIFTRASSVIDDMRWACT